MTSNTKWTDERTATLTSIAGSDMSVQVTKEQVTAAAEKLETTIQSVAAKLRKLGYQVASMAKEADAPKFSAEQAQALTTLVTSNPGQLTYAEIAAAFENGAYTTRQVQGKLLHLQLTGMVKPTEKAAPVRSYSEEEQEEYVDMAKNGATIEEIAAALNKSISSVRGKGLSLLREGLISSIPVQSNHVEAKVDPLTALGDKVAGMSVAEIAANLEKTERGVRTMLTKRGISCKDYDGAGKAVRAAAARSAA